MSHEITTTDHLVLHKKEAWHGLGTVVETAPTPGQALVLANLDWKVDAHNLLADLSDDRAADVTPISTHKALRRSDTGDILSVVGKAYEPLQNEELAMFAYDLAGEANVTIESAGSMKSGRRIWFLLKSDTLCIGNQCDEVEPYVLLYNSHDGSSAVEFMPTTVRVVCNNTLTMARSSRERGFKFRHTTNLRSNIGRGVQVMRKCMEKVELWNTAMNGLSMQEVGPQWLQEFWSKAYHELVSQEPTNQRRVENYEIKKEGTIQLWRETFDSEASEYGLRPTRWLAANAVTNWMDYVKPIRMTARGQHADATEAKQWDRVFGTTATRKEAVFEMAKG